LVLIAAVAENGVIGRGNQLPWRLKSDMQHFRRVTMGRPVVMGRKTFQSLFRPLAGRTTIVVTRDRDFAAPAAIVAHSLDAALAAARGDALRRGADAIMVAGGADIYAQLIAVADRLLMTMVHARPQGDALFPSIDANVWREKHRVERPAGPDDSAGFAHVEFTREMDQSAPVGSGHARAAAELGLGPPAPRHRHAL
jgi:dihydrofolate reductase